MEAVFERVSRDRIYAITGIQFLPINTLYQLYAACRATPHLIDAAQALVDHSGSVELLADRRAGIRVHEWRRPRSSSTPGPATWATQMLDEIGLPTRLLQPLVQPGAMIGPLQAELRPPFSTGTPVVAPACHDTASAVASLSASGNTAFLSSGTWSLLGTELREPVITSRAPALNFTNEGGVCGTTRLAEKHRRALAAAVLPPALEIARAGIFDYDACSPGASDERLAFRSLIDPDYPPFLNPANMPATIAAYCRSTGQPEPDSTSTAFARSHPREPGLQIPSGPRIARRASPAAVSTKSVSSAADRATACSINGPPTPPDAPSPPVRSRRPRSATSRCRCSRPAQSVHCSRRAPVIERSFAVERFEPMAADRWDMRNTAGFNTTWSSPVPETASTATKYLQILWDEAEALRPGGASARAPPLPLESAWSGSAHHEFWRRKHELEVPAAGSADRRARPSAGGQRQRRRSAFDRPRPASRSCTWRSSNIDRPLSR